jgi:hypothetical protein
MAGRMAALPVSLLRRTMCSAFFLSIDMGGADSRDRPIDLALIDQGFALGSNEISSDHAAKPVDTCRLRSRTRR